MEARSACHPTLSEFIPFYQTTQISSSWPPCCYQLAVCVVAESQSVWFRLVPLVARDSSFDQHADQGSRENSSHLSCPISQESANLPPDLLAERPRTVSRRRDAKRAAILGRGRGCHERPERLGTTRIRSVRTVPDGGRRRAGGRVALAGAGRGGQLDLDPAARPGQGARSRLLLPQDVYRASPHSRPSHHCGRRRI